MKIPPRATSYCPPVRPLHADEYRGRTIRHTFRPHGTKDWLLIYTQGGSGLYALREGGEFRSRSGDVTLHRPGAFHDYQYAPETGKWDLLWAHFLPRPEWQPWLEWPELAPGLLRLNLHEPALRQRVERRMRDVIRYNHTARQNLGLNALEEVILWCDSVNSRRSARRVDPRLTRAMELLSTRPREPYREKQIARAAGLSASRFRHLFREQVGDSPRHFQEQLRLRRARDLLALSQQTIAEIAAEVGFASPFYFTLRFKKHTGESPRAYRRRVAGGR